MNVHITLVGGQAAPIYIGIKETHPDKVFYVFSKQTKKVLKNIMAEVGAEIESEQCGPLDASDLSKIAEAAKEIKAKCEGCNITLNITGGTKAWSHVFASVFADAEQIYIDQEGKLWNLKRFTCKPTAPIPFKTYLGLYGNKDIEYKDLDYYTEEDADMIKLIEFARAYNRKAFTELFALTDKATEKNVRDNETGTITAADGSWVHWEKSSFNGTENDRVAISMAKKGQEPRNVMLKSPHAIDLLFGTTWFEFKVARIMAGWPKAKKVYMNCRYLMDTHNENFGKQDKNETDVIVETDSKFIFVECKTHLNNQTDIDKFKSVVSNYSGIATKGIFITGDKMNPVQKNKCIEHNLLSYHLNQQASSEQIAKELYKLLDDAFLEQNAK